MTSCTARTQHGCAGYCSCQIPLQRRALQGTDLPHPHPRNGWDGSCTRVHFQQLLWCREKEREKTFPSRPALGSRRIPPVPRARQVPLLVEEMG